jgi:hypothetical protein
MIIDGLKKRLCDENSKKGGKWIHELPLVVKGLRCGRTNLNYTGSSTRVLS